jgi:hypothetical protein
VLYKVYKDGKEIDGLLIDSEPDDVLVKMMKLLNISELPLVNKTKSGGLIYLNLVFNETESGRHLTAIQVYEIEEAGILLEGKVR